MRPLILLKLKRHLQPRSKNLEVGFSLPKKISNKLETYIILDTSYKPWKIWLETTKTVPKTVKLLSITLNPLFFGPLCP
jgi:hypothetical protein